MKDKFMDEKITSAERINRLASARGAASYLEIGVAKGSTFLRVDLSTKHAVDPKFHSTFGRSKPRPCVSSTCHRIASSPRSCAHGHAL